MTYSDEFFSDIKTVGDFYDGPGHVVDLIEHAEKKFLISAHHGESIEGVDADALEILKMIKGAYFDEMHRDLLDDDHHGESIEGVDADALEILKMIKGGYFDEMHRDLFDDDQHTPDGPMNDRNIRADEYHAKVKNAQYQIIYHIRAAFRRFIYDRPFEATHDNFLQSWKSFKGCLINELKKADEGE